MNAHDVFVALQPGSRIVDPGGMSAARSFIDELSHMKRASNWQRLDDLAQSASELNTDPLYPVLLLLLADAYSAQRIPRRVENLAVEALRLLQCQASPGCLQNQAVASLYVGLAHHGMNRISDTLADYQQAADQFRIAQSAWNASNPYSANVVRCGDSAHDIEAAARHLLASTIRSPIPGHSVPAWTPPPAGAAASVSPAPAPDQVYAHYWIVYCLSFIAWVVWLVVAGLLAEVVAAWLLADTVAGRLAVPASLAAYVSFGIGAVLGVLIWTRQSFVYRVPQGQTAIIEEGGRLLTMPPDQTRWLLPWYDSLRAFVLTKDLTVTLPAQTVTLATGPHFSSPLPVRVHVRYVVHDVIGFFNRVSGAVATQSHPITATTLKAEWDRQLAAYLSPHLAIQLYGATRSDLDQHKATIQENLKGELTTRAIHWSVGILDLTIHPVH